MACTHYETTIGLEESYSRKAKNENRLNNPPSKQSKIAKSKSQKETSLSLSYYSRNSWCRHYTFPEMKISTFYIQGRKQKKYKHNLVIA